MTSSETMQSMLMWSVKVSCDCYWIQIWEGIYAFIGHFEMWKECMNHVFSDCSVACANSDGECVPFDGW